MHSRRCSIRSPLLLLWTQGGRVTCMGISEVVYFSPRSPGENSWSSLSPSAVEHGISCGHRPCESLRPFPERVPILWRQATAW